MRLPYPLPPMRPPAEHCTKKFLRRYAELWHEYEFKKAAYEKRMYELDLAKWTRRAKVIRFLARCLTGEECEWAEMVAI